jgi:hypothetical protein
MLDLETVRAPQPPHDAICFIRARRRLPWCPRVIYEALYLHGEKIEVLAATREVVDESEEAALALRTLDALLLQEGWEQTKEGQQAVPDVVACYVRVLETPVHAGPDRREVCYVRARRPRFGRDGVVFEAVSRRDGKDRILARTKRVAGEGEEATRARDQLIRRLFRERWIPTKEPLIMGDDVLGVYVRPHRQSA